VRQYTFIIGTSNQALFQNGTETFMTEMFWGYFNQLITNWMIYFHSDGVLCRLALKLISELDVGV